jgi:hypothetical protein
MPRRQNQHLVRDEEHLMPPWLACTAEFAGRLGLGGVIHRTLIGRGQSFLHAPRFSLRVIMKVRGLCLQSLLVADTSAPRS